MRSSITRSSFEPISALQGAVKLRLYGHHCKARKADQPKQGIRLEIKAIGALQYTCKARKPCSFTPYPYLVRRKASFVKLDRLVQRSIKAQARGRETGESLSILKRSLTVVINRKGAMEINNE